MSGASDAMAALRAGVLSQNEAIRSAVTAYGNAVRAFMEASAEGGDLVDAMQAAPAVILAAEMLADSAGVADKEARRILAQQMMETGCTTVRTDHHTISAVDAPRRAFVSDMTQVPEAYVQTVKKADLTAIGAEFRAGRSVPGCALTNGGEPTLRILTKKAKMV